MLIVVLLAALTVVLLVLGAQRLITQKEEALRNRVEAITAENAARAAARATQERRALDLGATFSRWFGPELMRRQAELLASADLALRPGEFMTMRLAFAAVGALAGVVLLERPLSAAVLALVAYMLPEFYVRRRRERRRVLFDMQLPDALQLITNSLRAGFSFPKAVEVAAQSTTPPVSKDLNIVLRETNLGMAIDDALRNMARRVQSPDFDIVVSAYLIQREVGGNLAIVMEKVAETVRQRLRLRGEIRVLTAQGRFSGYIVGFLPLAVFGVLLVASPGYFDPMFKEQLGVFGLVGAVCLQICGALVIRKLVNIKM